MRVRALTAMCLGGLACVPPPEIDDRYEGSCPILLECAVELRADEIEPGLIAELVDAYGVGGTCWALGPNYWTRCRNSCVDTLGYVNDNTEVFGATCGACETDTDCVQYGTTARCEAGWCARSRAGTNIEVPGDSEDSGETGGSADIGDENIELDTACKGDEPIVAIVTDLGIMRARLDTVAASQAARAFLQHVSVDFYDETLVHRVIPGLLLQGGAYALGPTLVPPIKTTAITQPSSLTHTDGALVMVTRSNGGVDAQFYVTDGAQPSLDGKGEVIGELIEGLGVRDQIMAVETATVPGQGLELPDTPLEVVLVTEIYCEE